MIYAAPGTAGAKIVYKAQYNNFIGGKWVAPTKGEYFDVITPTPARFTPRPLAPQPKTSNWRSTPLTLRPMHGARPAQPSAPTCC